MKKIFVFLVILLSLLTIWPLFHTGLFPMHDNTQVARVFTMAKALHDGMLPVRWVDYLGYNLGYPIFNFYAPFAYYVGGFFVSIGYSAISATKIMMGLGMIAAGVSMYFLVSSLFGKKAGLLSAIFYTYAPYHALDLYVRGAIGELWAYAFLPLPFWGLWGLYKTQKFRYVVITAIGLAGIILSHNLTAMMVAPFIVITSIFLAVASWKKKEFITGYLFIISLVAGVLLSSFYALPALLEMSYTNLGSILGGGSNPLDHFVCLPQLWQSMWGYGGSAPGCIDGMSFMLGKLHVLFVLLGLVSMLYLVRKKLYQQLAVMLSCFIFLFLSIFILLPVSKPLWQDISALQYLQFPWRFLSLATLSASVISGGVIVAINRWKPFAALVMTLAAVCLAIFYYGKYFRPQSFQEDVKNYTDITKINWNISKTSDEYLAKTVHKPASQAQITHNFIQPLEGNVFVESQQEKTQQKIIRLNSSRANVRLNLAYFPAWQITVDGHTIKPIVAQGLYELPLAKGKHTIMAIFVQTPIEKLADFLSIVGLSLLIIGIIKASKSKSL